MGNILDIQGKIINKRISELESRYIRDDQDIVKFNEDKKRLEIAVDNWQASIEIEEQGILSKIKKLISFNANPA